MYVRVAKVRVCVCNKGASGCVCVCNKGESVCV